MKNSRQRQIDPLAPPLPLSRRLPLVVKIFSVLLIVILPLILIRIVLAPLASNRRSREIVYTLRDNFSQRDLNRLVQQMKRDPEYGFYFHVLGEQALSESVAQVYGYLELARDKAGMRQVVDRLKDRIERAADQILSLPVPEDFSHAPDRYEKACRSLTEFVRAEFVLTLSGICYKLRHDSTFFFTWSAEASRAAYRVHKIFSTLTEEQRQGVEQLLFSRSPLAADGFDKDF